MPDGGPPDEGAVGAVLDALYRDNAALRVMLRDLAIAADNAALLLREAYPGKAASLHAKVLAAREVLREGEGEENGDG